ncbi:CopD family protein [Lolliginicoccus levis]|uniref:CopD family protein n=1 Tax=Lolliginicoccus levis TaxID=2919542 RepID=UPI00241EF895|nr:CopD family protein [Lolliginicoccus levis]
MTPAPARAAPLLAGLAAATVSGACLALLLAPADPAVLAVGTRAAALGAGVATLGLAAVGFLHRSSGGPGRGKARAASLHERQWRMLLVVALAWMVLAAAQAVASAADLLGVPVLGLSLAQLGEYAVGISAGQVSLVVLACTLLIAGMAILAQRGTAGSWDAPACAIAALALVCGPLSGHAMHSSASGLLVAVHVLAAGSWCGGLVAIALTARSRSEWSHALPAFSRLAWWCVLALAASGVAAAALVLPGPAALPGTGYGRILLAKTALLIVLLGLGWRARANWVGAARAHQHEASRSLRRSVIEAVVMAVALGIAAALAATPVPLMGDMP